MVWLKQLLNSLCTRTKGKTESVTVSSSVKNSVAFQARAIRANPGEGQSINVRRAGWFETTTSTEMDTARRFAIFAARPFIEFTKASENNDVDIFAKSSDSSAVQEFQITRLWHGDFWKRLKTAGAVDMELTRDQLLKLIHEAIDRKGDQKYTAARRKEMMLLIDTNPEGIRKQLCAAIRSALQSHLERVGFKEIRLVGPDRENTFQIPSS